MKKHVLEFFLAMLCMFCISYIGYAEGVIEKQQKTQGIKTPIQSVKPASRPGYIRTIEQDVASMREKAKQLTQMIRRIKGLRSEQRSNYLKKAVRDANSLLQHMKAFEKKLGDLHSSGPESGMSEADKIKIRGHLEGIQEYMSEAISITRTVAAKTRTFASVDHEPQDLAVEESDSEEPDTERPSYEDCASNIDSEDCSGVNNCYSCCSDVCGDVPDIEDERAYNSYLFCKADCRDYCLWELMVCVVRLTRESNTNNLDALTGL